MDQAVAYSTLALTVTLAVSRPRVGIRGLRVTPGAAALVGVVVLLLTGILTFADMLMSAMIQWRPILSLTCIMIMTGVVHEVGAFERLALRIEAYARRTSTARTFAIVFAVSVVTPSLLNNDSAILLLTPLVVALTRRLYPGRNEMTVAFAFAVFLAPGVAPFVISNPMNMIVAEFAGVGFNAYARIMVPISLAGAAVTFFVLNLHFRKLFTSVRALPAAVVMVPAHPAERAVVVLLLLVFGAYPFMAALGAPIWIVSIGGAIGCVALAWRYRIASARKVLHHVSPDILVFLWGVFLVVTGLRHVGVVERLAYVYAAEPSGSLHGLGVVAGVAALGSAIVDNHPMALLDMMALGSSDTSRPLLAALIGGDIGPRLLPIGSLGGLLWMQLLRRSGVEIGIGKFVWLGTLVLLPTLAVSVLLLYLSGPA
jgi:arsenical pump membrane protein